MKVANEREREPPWKVWTMNELRFSREYGFGDVGGRFFRGARPRSTYVTRLTVLHLARESDQQQKNLDGI